MLEVGGLFGKAIAYDRGRPGFQPLAPSTSKLCQGIRVVPRKLFAGLCLGLGAAGLVLLLGWTGVLDTPELWTYDWRIRQAADPSSLHKDIAFVEFNDTTIRDLAPHLGRWPWPRVVYASFIDYLSRAPAKVIAVDFAFLEPDGTLGAKIGEMTITAKESDAALVESVRQSRSVVLLADAVYQGTVDRHQATAPAEWRNRSPKFHLGPAIEERPIVIPPFQELTDVAAGARTQPALRSIRMGARGAWRRSSAPATITCHHSAWRRR